MSEYETIEAIRSFNEMAVHASMNFVAIFFAYLVAAHLAGRKLPTFVAIGMTVIYTLIEIPHIVGTYAFLEDTYGLIQFLVTTYPDSPIANDVNIPFQVLASLFCIPMLVGWCGSIYYMHFYIRGRTGGDI